MEGREREVFTTYSKKKVNVATHAQELQDPPLCPEIPSALHERH